MLILGLNAYHGDSAACIVRDGTLLAAAEEERFRRIKHWAGLPTEAIRFCLREAGASLQDVDHLAINRNPGVNNGRRMAFLLWNRPSPKLVLAKLKNMNKVATVEDALREAFPGQTLRAKIHRVEHHQAHLASAYLASPFEEAVCVSVDGFGDFASAAWGISRGNDMVVDGRVYFPHSLGIFYSALTQFLGFLHFGDEYKVMGLAPYGRPKFMTEMRELVRVQSDGIYQLNLRYFRHHNENVSYSWNNCSPEVGMLYNPVLAELLGPARAKSEVLETRHKDIACSIQAMYEEALFALLNKLHERYRCSNLALSGGCAMNSVANGKVYRETPFRRLYLPAAAGDAGGAIGGALVVATQIKLSSGAREIQRNFSSPLTPLNQERKAPKRTSLNHAYLGPEFGSHYISSLLKEPFRSSQDPGQTLELEIQHLPNVKQLCARTVEAIAEGRVIGWFQGRMEWGPRSLGNRSILGDPRRADMKNILNLKIKRRESFRPFAPSVLRERVADWFEQEDDVPFMMSVFQVRAEKRDLIPAVTHVDGSGRLHTVDRATNPLYHQLILQFEEMTGVPMVLNTSFNENEPVVCKPEEALDCFLRTKMDFLVLGEYFVSRSCSGQDNA